VRPGDGQPIVQGAVASAIGFAGSFTIVVAGLRGVGAGEAQVASGLLALSVLMGLVAVWLGLRRRMPIAIAWSTPGAALLAATGAPDGGFAAAVGAFLVCGAALALAGAWRTLGRWIAAIPTPIASAMLAGVVLQVCLGPVKAVQEVPELALPVVATWLVLTVVARRWAVLGALVAAVVAIALSQPLGEVTRDGLLPPLALTAPRFEWGAIVGIALPLFIVTMASQNIPGMSVLASFGYRPPLRPLLVSTGAASVAAAPFGGHAINLAAITAALSAGPEAHPDPERRWLASVSGGVTYLVLGLGAGLATAFIAASPPVLIEAVAGLALLGALAGALTGAMADPDRREAATLTLVVSASGLTVAGVGAPFWGLLAGLALLGAHRVLPRVRARRAGAGAPPRPRARV
jgi:benzoate membrane transport protein